MHRSRRVHGASLAKIARGRSVYIKLEKYSVICDVLSSTKLLPNTQHVQMCATEASTRSPSGSLLKL